MTSETSRDRVSSSVPDYATLAANGSAAALVYVDATDGPRWMNPAAALLLGVDDIDQLRRPAGEVLSAFVDEDGRSVQPPPPVVNEVLVTGRAGGPLIVGRRLAQDRTQWLEVSGRPVLEADGRVGAAILSFVDVTERQESRRAEQAAAAELRSVFEAMNDGVVVQSAAGAIDRKSVV